MVDFYKPNYILEYWTGANSLHLILHKVYTILNYVYINDSFQFYDILRYTYMSLMCRDKSTKTLKPV